MLGIVADWNYRRLAKKLCSDADRTRDGDPADFPVENARIQIIYPLVIVGTAVWYAQRPAMSVIFFRPLSN